MSWNRASTAAMHATTRRDMLGDFSRSSVHEGPSIMASFPDYYRVLNIEQSATGLEIRTAYMKEALRTHPDRIPNASAAEKRKATEKFQAVGEAYYVLSDPTRRREYDAGLRSEYSKSSNTSPAEAEKPNADGIFAEIFAEVTLTCFVITAGSSRPFALVELPSAGFGFMVGSFPGILVGAAAGNRLGAVRDAKGKSVLAAFDDLDANHKAEILHALSLLVFGSATAL
ncbi:DnaJ-domain-containing protein [Mycena sanguinolenta]|uniref:DnaJ-domain-containing protein n=1 Tax=Mycena sanguinolenta TaxID=230812 RepID=A0A8H6ZJL5_9AGAR|nr:DnaJ-domain-containing protein [Mycena sanguinolenta]